MKLSHRFFAVAPRGRLTPGFYVLRIDGSGSPVVVNNEGTVQLDGNVAGGKGLNIYGAVTWTNNGLNVVGNQNNTQFKVLSGGYLTVSEGTTFDFYNQTWCDGTVTNLGTFKIGGLFFGGGVSSSQVNAGIMEFRSRVGCKVVNSIDDQPGDFTFRGVELEQNSTVEGGLIHFAGGNSTMYRSSAGNSLSLLGAHTTDLEAGRTLSLARNSTFTLDAAGSYDFDGSIVMNVSVWAYYRVNTDAKIVARNGAVDMAGDGSLSMNAGIATYNDTDYLRHSILTGESATDALVNNLAGGISGSGKIGNDASSFVNNALIDATDATYPLEFDPADAGSISNLVSGTIRATGAAGLLFRDGTFVNQGTLEVLADSQAVFTNGLVLVNDGGTLGFKFGAVTTQAPVVKVYGDVTLSGTLAVDLLPSYDGTEAVRHDVIACSGGTITDNGITFVGLDSTVPVRLVDNGTIDGTVTIEVGFPGGTLMIVR